MVKKIFYLLLSMIILYTCNSCKSGNGKGGNDDFIAPDEVVNQNLEINPDDIEGFIENMSSPVEMAFLVKALDVQYSNKYLAPAENVENYVTEAKQSFCLGVYSADLGYLNMYNKTNTVLDYIGAIRILADAINVGQFFDFTTLKRLAQSNQNLDSLMYISVKSFNQMDRYLRNDKRSNLSILIISGVWVEGMYLVTQVYNEKPDPEIKEKIGEQKIILDKLMLFLDTFKGSKQFDEVINQFQIIYDEFDDVRIYTEPGEGTMEERDGMLVYVQNDKSVVEISEERIQSIIQKTEEVRNKLISQ